MRMLSVPFTEKHFQQRRPRKSVGIPCSTALFSTLESLGPHPKQLRESLGNGSQESEDSRGGKD